MTELLSSLRIFQIWRMVVGHQQLLLRSAKTDTSQTRQEVLFKGVRAMKLRSTFEGLVIRSPDPNEAELISCETGETQGPDCNFYVLEANGFFGYVVADAIATNEDEATTRTRARFWWSDEPR